MNRRKEFLANLNAGRSWSDAENLVSQMGIDQIVELSEARIEYLESLKEFYVPSKRMRSRERVSLAVGQVHQMLQQRQKVAIWGVS